ncbi:MAG: signal recognition particle receptor subunit alpha, partial [Deltaproteobacteria bacterium]|nr:signal recognition particle receptor subunit alpha [Deltaproteobacteria bacterium]
MPGLSKKKDTGKEIKDADQDKGLFQRLQQGLLKTRSTFTGRLDRLFLGKKEITDDLLEELEEILFTSDIGVTTTQELIDSVQ